jgi:hypothetical protein
LNRTMTRCTVCSLVVLDGNRDGLEPLLLRFPRAAEEHRVAARFNASSWLLFSRCAR